MADANLSQSPPKYDLSWDQTQTKRRWRALYLLNIYRLIIALTFFVFDAAPWGPNILGKTSPLLFQTTSIIYLIFAIIGYVVVRLRRPDFRSQVSIQVMLDITVITLLMHASGGISSGLGMLLVPAVAGGSLLIEGRLAILFAAMASIGILSEQLYTQITEAFTSTYYTQTGMLGATYFATAILAYVLAKRTHESEALAKQRGLDLADLKQLNNFIIQRMQSGVVVIDDEGSIRLMNQAAWYLLGMPDEEDRKQINRLSEDLDQQLQIMRDDPEHEPCFFKPANGAVEVLPRFTRLEQQGSPFATIVFLEDASILDQQVQQMKLASLGHLTANIAHEIRNPLSAISHAGQLLSESEALDEGDIRLTQIIRDHSARMNTIIENVMQISRRSPSNPEDIPLSEWAKAFAKELSTEFKLAPDAISIVIDPPTASIRMDRSQLHQVTWNLCQNILQHGSDNHILIEGGIDTETAHPYLDFIDNGPAINKDTARKLFEPFFTTRTQGTGLGLYIARELCLLNQAQLNYHPTENGGNRFRITFDDPRRQLLRT